MARVKVGHFEADGALIYLPIGFVPSRLLLIDFSTDTNIDFYWWFSAMEQDEVSGKQEGISVLEGVTANLADAGGITEYDTGTEGPSIASYTTTLSTAATARTSTAAGTFLKPSTTGTIKDGSDADRSLVFECVSAGTAVAEPAWPTAVGEQVTDGSGGTTFELVVEPTLRRGYQGVCIAAALMTNGVEMYYEAVLADSDVDHGDVDSWSGGIEG